MSSLDRILPFLKPIEDLLLDTLERWERLEARARGE